ncbi:DUF6421 family protein [Priestia taiwanensis]|uniref:DUF6421 family protein n=1 Tax=Priestia taiwanensis TaxID=1347902 RepID=UPI00166CDBD2|nr:DUF6421 family protein [Priestia taiwanensis]
MLTKSHTHDLVNILKDKVLPNLEEIRNYQGTNGEIIKNHERAKVILLDVVAVTEAIYESLHLTTVWNAFKKDVLDWIERGIDQTPYFDRTLLAYSPPANGEGTFFLGPIVTPNGPTQRGFYLEAFLAVREEPEIMKSIEEDLPHPKNGCESLKLIIGTQGFMEGKCIVFFPENVKTKENVTSQNFAMFFFNKFHRIYNEDTLKRAGTIFPDFNFKSTSMSREDTYKARVIWGYLHDYYHHCGKKPFDQHIQAKMNFFAGILEEVKVDCQTILTLTEKKYSYWEEITEFVLFERLLRYPSQHNAARNFDSGTGFFLFSWLVINGNSIVRDDNWLHLDVTQCLQELRALVEEIEELETIHDDYHYKQEAERYVRQYLLPSDNGDKFIIPDKYFINEQNKGIQIPYLTFNESNL